MDRIDAMKVFVAAIDEGSLAGAARRLKRSPTAVSRALSFLEAHVGVELLHRTTRTLKLSEAGQRYAAACRRVLTDLEEADMLAGGERSAPRGMLTISSPPILGEEILRPILDDFLDLYPTVSVRLLLLDRFVNLVDEGVDIALRIGQLADSSLISTRLGGDVRRVVVASPRYLANHPRIEEPADLAKHQILAFTNFGLESWSFTPRRARPSPERSSLREVHSQQRARRRRVGGCRARPDAALFLSRRGICKRRAPRNRARRCRASAPAGASHRTAGPDVGPQVRAFADFAAPRLRSEFARMAAEAGTLT